MKNYILLFFFVFSCFAFSQVEVGAQHYQRKTAINAEVLEKFKNSTTLFVFPDWVSEEAYDSMLKDIWTVTPYEIIALDDFEINDLYEENYSFFTLDFRLEDGKSNFGNSIKSLSTYLDLSLYNGKEIKTQYDKFNVRVRDKKLPMLRETHRTSLAKCYLYPEETFLEIARKGSRLSTIESIYADDIFYNYSEGLLKNYLQQLQRIILNGNRYLLESKDFDMFKLAELANKTLYIPEYTTYKTNVLKGKVSPRKDKEIDNLLQLYDYSYELISDQELNEAIMNKKELLYLRYVRIDDKKYIQIVNSLTGKVIYKDYQNELTFNLKQKNFEDLSLAIAKVNGESKK